MILLLITTTSLIISLLLICFVLAQPPKDEGGYNGLGSNTIRQMIGTPYMASLLEKLTYTLVALLFVLTLADSLILKRQQEAKKQDNPNLVQATAYGVKKDPQANKQAFTHKEKST